MLGPLALPLSSVLQVSSPGQPCSGREQLSQLSVHVEMASGVNRALEADQLTAVGKLEQDVVFGEVTSKHILEFFTAYPDLSPEAKVVQGLGFKSGCPHSY